MHGYVSSRNPNLHSLASDGNRKLGKSSIEVAPTTLATFSSCDIGLRHMTFEPNDRSKVNYSSEVIFKTYAHLLGPDVLMS